MILINFSHPITEEQQAKIEALTNHRLEAVLHVPSQFDHEAPFSEQVAGLVDSISLSPEEWQNKPLLIIPPAYNFAAVTLMAELHGRMGYFPGIVRIRPVPESSPPRFEIAEIINLQAVREQARLKR
ncbi:MAG: CRISPR-associated protein Csx15 [Candidatus Cloacimonetes bacterium]|nr:CRISPR-associated protein Csx15 [Candidatus Cloacimonadota bacterium]